jgi:uncharacterized protein (AIM24 family)
MRSALFEPAGPGVPGGQRYTVQNPQLLRVRLGADLVAVAGTVVAHQGSLRVDQRTSATTHRSSRRPAGGEGPLVHVSGEGEVFLASESGLVHLVELTGDSVWVNVHNLLAFDTSLTWDLSRVHAAGPSGESLVAASLTGPGTVAVHTAGTPMVLDCTSQPTWVDSRACVAWSGDLTPEAAAAVDVRSMLRGGSGQASQYVFHGPGLVVIQPGEWTQRQRGTGFHLGGLLDG